MHVLTEDHRHIVDGEEWPGVTHLLSMAKVKTTPPDGNFYLDRGTAIHLATELDDKGELDEDSVDPYHVRPWLESYRLWKQTMKRLEILTIEQLVRNSTWRYAGKVDRIVKIRARKGILDLKSGPPERWHRLQTMGYRLCYKKPMARFALYLKSDGAIAQLKVHDDPSDEGAFVGAMALANWNLNGG